MTLSLAKHPPDSDDGSGTAKDAAGTAHALVDALPLPQSKRGWSSGGFGGVLEPVLMVFFLLAILAISLIMMKHGREEETQRRVSGVLSYVEAQQRHYRGTGTYVVDSALSRGGEAPNRLQRATAVAAGRASTPELPRSAAAAADHRSGDVEQALRGFRVSNEASSDDARQIVVEGRYETGDPVRIVLRNGHYITSSCVAGSRSVSDRNRPICAALDQRFAGR